MNGRRVIISGDTIYDRGQVWDLYSLQRGFARNKRRIGDYHGFLGAHWQLSESLGRIKEARPEMLVPSHGPILRDPAGAIDALLARLATCYDKYVAISALRHYLPELFSEFAGRKDHMAIRPGKMDDSWVRCHPYEQTATPGARVDLRVVVTNHSTAPQQAACRGLLHPATSGRPTEWRRDEIAAKSEKEIRLSLAVPDDAAPGRHVLSIDVRYGPWDLPQFTEAIVVIPG